MEYARRTNPNLDCRNIAESESSLACLGSTMDQMVLGQAGLWSTQKAE
jgi:hypothetical protein